MSATQKTSRPDDSLLDPNSFFAGGKRAASGRRWRLIPSDERETERMAQKLDLDPALARLLSQKGITADAAPDYLTPSLKKHMPDPVVMQDMAAAATAIADVVVAQKKIGIFGDYDVDGTTSSALLSRYLKYIGVVHHTHLPDRLTEGYGPNLPAFLALKEKGVSLCITADCGAMAHQVLEEVRHHGLEMVVLDHHQMTLPPPPAAAVVNPNRPDDISGLTNLSAAGVTFMLLAALTRELRGRGFFAERTEPPLLEWLDLVALGLVCDVMPLTGLTRVLVAQGLKIMGSFADDRLADRRWPGVAALAAVAGASGPASAYHLGFILGPRINAAGRIGHANMALKLLVEEDPVRAMETARQLDALNAERQQVESDVLAAAEAQIAAKEHGDGVLIAAGEGWHPGVIGIAAGRLKEKFNLPTIVIGFDGEDGKGSGRSLSGVDLGAAIAAAVREGIINGGGGHAMAAGLSLVRDQLPAFQRFLDQRLGAEIKEARANPVMEVSGEAGAKTVTKSFADALAAAGPFGQGNPEPRFVLAGMQVRYADIKGTNHVAVTLADAMGQAVRGIAFRAAEDPFGRLLLAGDGRRLHVAGKIRPDDWRGGNAAQIHIEDVMEA